MAAGDVLGGRYGLRRRLDVLFGAERWLAEDDTLTRAVEICVMPEEHPRAEAVLDAARQASGVSDQRLVRVLDVGTEAGHTYVVTEWVDGDTLTELVRHGPLAADQARTLVGESALALEQARRRGLHHLLLSSDNVLRLDDGSVKVAGLAVDAALAGLETADPSDASRQDTFGLVAVAYAALTGFWPTSSRYHHDYDLGDSGLPSAPDVAGAPVAPAQIVSGVPADLDRLCVQAFSGRGVPDTPGDLAGQIAPWGDRVRQDRPTGAFPLTLPPLRRDGEPGEAPPRGQRTPPPRLPVAPAPASPPPRQPAPQAAASHETTAAPRPTTEPSAPPAGPRPAAPRAAQARPAASPPAASPPVASVPVASAGQHGSRPVGGRSVAAESVGPSTAAFHMPTPDDAAAWGGIFDDTAREQPAPLLPATPLNRPPGTQTRTVLILVGIFVIIMLALAKCGLSGLGDNAFVHKPKSATTPSATPSGTSTTSTMSPSQSPTGGGEPVSIRTVTSFDPQGDGEEKQSIADKAADGDPGTDWTSDAYKSATFSGLKDGVGLRLDLGSDTAVHEVKVTVPRAGTSFQLRSMPRAAQDLSGSREIASAADADGTVTLTLDKPVTTRYLLLWFTKAVQDKDGYRVAVSEVSVQ